MKAEQFEAIIDTQIEMIRDTLIVKAKEYATEDRLHNFRTVATLRDCTMEQALGGMLSKHTVSIYDMIESGKEFTSAQWDEKINDHIGYLLMLKAITVEKEICELDISMDKICEVALKTMNEFAEQTPVLGGISTKEFQENMDALRKTTEWHNRPQDSMKIMYNHTPEAPHLTTDELLLALEIKQILADHNKKVWSRDE